jgi:hypothetical protein
MEKIVVLTVSTIAGSIGWWLGDRVGLTTAFVASIVGTAAGVYVARRWAREYLP